MSNINRRGARAGSWLALLFCFLALFLILPATASGGGSTIRVGPPNGKDDTANIQNALNACVAKGPGCTVQLGAGTYLTQQVVVYNFQGTFKGMGIDSTTIEALPDLPANWPDGSVRECQPNLTTCIWPSLFEFVEGNISVSDLTIKATAVPATVPWVEEGTTLTMLYEVLGFMGQHPTDVSIDRIRMEGQTSGLSTDWGYNVVNGVHYSGELPRSSAPYDFYFLSGSFAVRSSFFNNLYVAVSQDAYSTSSQITIGGSPSAGNQIENTCGGLDMEASEKSVFEISYNGSSGTCAGMWVVPAWVPFVPSSPSRYSIHDNTFIGTEENADGMYLLDDVTKPWIQAAVWNNIGEVTARLSEGIGIYNTKGTAAWNNTVTGSDGSDGIGLWSTTLDTVINNNVSGFSVDSTVGLAQIYLDPSTTQDLVVCAEPTNTVLNQGSNNTIIGCQQQTATPAAPTDNVAPAVSKPKPNLPKGKPRQH
jgi:hypothetical protein